MGQGEGQAASDVTKKSFEFAGRAWDKIKGKVATDTALALAENPDAAGALADFRVQLASAAERDAEFNTVLGQLAAESIRIGVVAHTVQRDAVGGDMTKAEQAIHIERVDHLHIQQGGRKVEPAVPEAPPPSDRPLVSIARLPVTGAELFGREEELARLDAAWADVGTNVIAIVAHGGVGKSALVNHWLAEMGVGGWRGAERVYGWSFYSQGARQDATASADAFIGEALADFGDPDPDAGSPFQKGERLARLVKASRTLLVHDGTEPLQDPIDGRLRDPALASVVRELAADNPGLCVVTTRQAVADLASHPRAAPALDLEALGEDAGAAYLRALGVAGPDGELRAASLEFGGHASALKLLGTYLREAHGGDVRLRSEVAILDQDAERGGHAWRVMASYEGRLDAVETAVARVLGLFDRPADAADRGGATRGAGDPRPDRRPRRRGGRATGGCSTTSRTRSSHCPTPARGWSPCSPP